jgi:hypothetical protein
MQLSSFYSDGLEHTIDLLSRKIQNYPILKKVPNIAFQQAIPKFEPSSIFTNDLKKLTIQPK